TRHPWRGLTFADVLSAHPEILHPLSGTGRPAQLPRFDNCVKTNACIASDVRKHRFRCQKSITAYCCSFFHFRQAFLSSVLIAHVHNKQAKQAFGKNIRPHRRGFARGIRRAEERTEARTARHGSRDEDGCAKDGASGRSVRPQ
ncbi:hypothetical protein, partial [Pantoea ananatis]|uniref:hypothetical protein n=1 Tax=Pantoea ananas TaxID=553 RepID=UPI001B3025DC